MLKPSAAFILYLKRSGLFLGMMSLCRCFFYWLNSNYFTSVSLTDFIQGIRFDALAGVFVLAPFLLLHGIPFRKFANKFVQKGMFIYFTCIVILFIGVSCIDMIYFRFTLKRSTWDIFHYVTTGDDVMGLIPQFLADYWYVFILFICLSVLTAWVYQLIPFPSQDNKGAGKFMYVAIMFGLAFLAGRGGFQLKPLHIIDASRYTQTANVPLVLCTPFTLLKSYDKEQLEVPAYFESEDIVNQYFNPIITHAGDSTHQQKNIVVIIMESMSREYIGYYNEGKGYTPFLDSLMLKSIVFENAFANGRRSIEALPAIFSGIPNLMNEAFVTSPYAGNNIASLASILHPLGYKSHFFHGGKNGTMGFNSYAKSAGFDNYYGLDEYPYKTDFDGFWGIYDGPYFQYVADVQKTLKPPFLTGIFSLSAHHPYGLPEGTKLSCQKTGLPIHLTICYADQALQLYFEKIRNEAWYKKSVFILTADHTAESITPVYNTSKGIYAIPIVIFDPSMQVHLEITKTTQQTDITPTILDYLGLPFSMVCFGQSALDTSRRGFAINYLQDIYQLIEDEQILLFDGNQVIGGGNHQTDPLLKKNIYKSDPEAFDRIEHKLKAIIQSYNFRMMNNRLIFE